MEEVKKLSEKLAAAREAYYNLDPIMSDSEYDALRDELKRLSPDDPEIKAVGAAPLATSLWEEARHEIPMGSLEKVNSVQEFESWCSKTGAEIFSVTHKIDGASLELVYESGKLVRAVTRGDGIVGDNITSNIVKVPNIPHELPGGIDATVRGEIVIFKNVFEEKYADVYANPRNTVSSKMREKKNKGADCANMKFLGYWIRCDGCPGSMSELFRFLDNLGFETPEIVTGPVQTVKDKFQSVTESRDSVPYEIDGMVAYVDDIEAMQALGEVSMRPKGQIAWKFESEKAVSTALNVVWQVGLTGRVTGVLKIEPTKIGGVTIENVSLHNLKMFRKLRLFKGCKVLVSRRNDCIPYVEQNLDYDEEPNALVAAS